jgi:hypothetical protein
MPKLTSKQIQTVGKNKKKKKSISSHRKFKYAEETCPTQPIY